MKKTSFILVVLISLFSCEDESKIENEISEIDVNYAVERFDSLFSEAKPKDLPQLKAAFPFFFSKHINDSVWIRQMNDTLQQHLSAEVEKTFKDFKDIDNDIKGLLQHLKYYDKTFSEPRVITLTNFVDYRNKIKVTDTILLIALDNYLGNNHEFYSGIQKFLTQNMDQRQIVPDLATAYSKNYIYQSQKNTFLDEMIYFGKQLYFKDKTIPFKSDAEKIGYTQEQLEWSMANESYIWSYFVGRELLFSTDKGLISRFIAPAPFSKFYLKLDAESPGRLGQYMGWQIVRAYMEQNKTSLLDMLQKDAEEIFNNVKFKPRK
jgi:gliding motility-associated lipoprotein GldB